MLMGREQRTTNNSGMIEKELMLMGMAIPLLLSLRGTHPILDCSTY